MSKKLEWNDSASQLNVKEKMWNLLCCISINYKFSRITNSSKPSISTSKIQKAEDAIIQFISDQWDIVKQTNDAFNEFTLRVKEHYMINHMVPYMNPWGISIGRVNEQSVEAVQKVGNQLLPKYNNFDGCWEYNVLWIIWCLGHHHCINNIVFDRRVYWTSFADMFPMELVLVTISIQNILMLF